uniref:Peptidase S1 domain-containing protein n=1 Tax=Globodera pallida TaxID=36090 RepID=A0A183CTW5_GLOPA
MTPLKNGVIGVIGVSVMTSSSDARESRRDPNPNLTIQTQNTHHYTTTSYNKCFKIGDGVEVGEAGVGNVGDDPIFGLGVEEQP